MEKWEFDLVSVMISGSDAELMKRIGGIAVFYIFMYCIYCMFKYSCIHCSVVQSFKIHNIETVVCFSI